MTGIKDDTKGGQGPKSTSTRSTMRLGKRPPPSSPAGHRDPPNQTPVKPKTPNQDSANIAKILDKLDNLDSKIESTKDHLSQRIDGSHGWHQNASHDSRAQAD